VGEAVKRIDEDPRAALLLLDLIVITLEKVITLNKGPLIESWKCEFSNVE